MNANVTASIPHDSEAEQAVLGSIIYDNTSIYEVLFLSPESFYVVSNQYIFRAIVELHELKKPIDEVLIGDQLKTRDQLEEAGGYSYLANLVDCSPSTGNIKFYGKIVREKSILRQLIETTAEISKKASHPDQVSTELLVEVVSAVEKINADILEDSYHNLNSLLVDRFNVYETFGDESKPQQWLKTGFFDLDERIIGLEPGKMYVVAGRPAMGKTSFLISLILSAGKVNKIQGVIVVISYEMTKEELTDRFITTEAKVNLNVLKRGNLDKHKWDDMVETANYVSSLNVIILDSRKPVEVMTSELKIIEKKFGKIALIGLDYLQKAKVSDTRLPREQQVSKVSGLCKEWAIEFNCPTVPLCQLNRDLEKRQDKHPQMSDLRESGSIEQDADVIMFIYRDEIYNEDSPKRGIAEICLDKQRSGPVSMCELAYKPEWTRFDNLDVQQQF